MRKSIVNVEEIMFVGSTEVPFNPIIDFQYVKTLRLIVECLETFRVALHIVIVGCKEDKCTLNIR